jgi:hypothetical protein
MTKNKTTNEKGKNNYDTHSPVLDYHFSNYEIEFNVQWKIESIIT